MYNIKRGRKHGNRSKFIVTPAKAGISRDDAPRPGEAGAHPSIPALSFCSFFLSAMSSATGTPAEAATFRGIAAA